MFKRTGASLKYLTLFLKCYFKLLLFGRCFVQSGFVQSIVGQTPLIKIKSLSEQTGCHIWGKAEFLNPGGSVKDRAALGIIRQAEKDGKIKRGSTIYDGTAGNTGIGLATLAAQMGYKVKLVLPDNQAIEKYLTLEALGAEIVKVKPVPFVNQEHFYHQARRLAESDPNGYWANQFENLANYQFHLETTGPEIWEQTNHQITDFCAAVGTGGTLAGVSNFLKGKNKNIHVALIDPLGSGLYNYITKGEMTTEGASVTEGIGIMRLTANFQAAKVDEALRVTDKEMIDMLYHLAQTEGLLVGTSAALNIFGAWKIAQRHQGQGRNIVTILCDGALRYQSKIFNTTWLKEKNLIPSPLQ